MKQCLVLYVSQEEGTKSCEGQEGADDLYKLTCADVPAGRCSSVQSSQLHFQVSIVVRIRLGIEWTHDVAAGCAALKVPGNSSLGPFLASMASAAKPNQFQ